MTTWRVVRVLFVSVFLPGAAFASMAYVPSRPCGEVMANVPVYQNIPSGWGDNGWTYYRGYDERYYFQKVQPQVVEEDVEITDEPEPEVSNTEKRKSGFTWQNMGLYVGLNGGTNLWSWENKYSSDYDGVNVGYAKEKYSFEPVWAASVAVGATFSENLRGDLELGMTNNFKDTDDLAEYKVRQSYVMLNAYRDFESGLYLGGGLGVAKVVARLGGEFFGDKTGEETITTFKVGLSAGFATPIADNVYVDLRYRLSGLKGAKISNNSFLWDQYAGEYKIYSLKIKSDFMLENAFSVGVRVNF